MTSRGSSASVTPALVRRMAGLFKPYWLWLLVGLLLSALFGLTEPLLLQLLKPILDHGSKEAAGEPLSYAIPAVIISLALLRGLFLFSSTYLLDRVSETMKRSLMAHTLRHTLQMPLSYFDQEDSAVLLRKVAHHVSALKDAFLAVMSPFVQGTAKMIGYIALLLYTEWQLALIFLVVMPVLGLVMAKYARRWRDLYRRADEAEGGFGQYLIEIFRAARVVKAFGAEQAESERYARHLAGLYGVGMRARIAVNVARVAVQVCVALTFALAILAGIHYYNEGRMTVGELGVFTGALLLMPIAIRRVTDVVPRFYAVARSAEVVFALLDEQTEAGLSGAEAEGLSEIKGAIEFREVSFSYRGSSTKALDRLNLSIAGGEKTALIGKTGSGKSTLISLLLRLYDPSEGEVLLDGRSLKRLSLGELRSQFSWVTQEPYLFSGSFASNIAYPDSRIDMERVRKAAAQADLSGFVESLPEGYNAGIGEAGVRLSGGQRQRLSIARAFYRASPILLLDEITSALDSITESNIIQSLRELSRNRTVIVISHRLSAIHDVNRIVLLDQGRIECQGTHDELLAESGAYRRLCAAQQVDLPLRSDGADPAPEKGAKNS